MKTISHEEYEALYTSGRPDDLKYGYPAMIYHPDGTITKIWAKPPRLLSSARIKPYARRFVENATMIQSLGIKVPKILDHFKIEKTHIHIVRYQTLPGKSIRDLLKAGSEKLDIPRLATFILSLHNRGVEFRTIHFGNIIQLEDNTYGLIDFCDISHNEKPLTPERRAVNLAVPLKYKNDMALMQQAELPSLKDAYLKTWNPEEADQRIFLTILKERLRRLSS